MVKLKLALPLLTGLVIIALIVGKLGIFEVASTIAKVNIESLILFEFALVGALALKGIRWHLLANKIALLHWDTTAYTYLAGQTVNEILPTGSGEITRVYLTRRHAQKHAGEWLAAVSFERAFDVLFLVCGALLSLFLFFPAYAQTTIFLFAFVLLGLTAVAVAFLKPNLIHRLFAHLSFLGSLNERWFRRLELFGKSFAQATLFYKNSSAFFATIGLTAAGWSLELLGQTILLQGFGIQVSFWQVFAIGTVSWIIGTFSFLPGGLGARETAFSYLTTQLIPTALFATVFSMTLVYRGLVYVSLILLGTIAAAYHKRSLIRAVLKAW